MAVSKDVLRSTEMLASMDTVSSTIPKMSGKLLVPLPFFLNWNSKVISLLIDYDCKYWNLLDQLSKIIRIRSIGDGVLCNCFAVSNKLHLLVG